MKLKVPFAVGIPLITPVVGLNERPGGRLPLTTTQLEYGGDPPVAASCCAYGAPNTPEGSGELVLIAKVDDPVTVNVTALLVPNGVLTVMFRGPDEAAEAIVNVRPI